MQKWPVTKFKSLNDDSAIESSDRESVSVYNEHNIKQAHTQNHIKWRLFQSISIKINSKIKMSTGLIPFKHSK